MTTKMMKGLNYLVMFVLLNLLWAVGIVCGLFFGGLVPSTYALIKLCQDRELFDGYAAYWQVVKRFCSEWLTGLKAFRLSVLLFPAALLVTYLDILVVQQNSLMKALFLWPALLLLCYLLLAMVQFCYVQTVSDDSLKAKLLAALTAPLLLPVESLLSLLVFGSFFILCLRFNWLFFVLAVAVLFVTCKLLENGYRKKGLVVHE